jgi:hypothetical protein
VYSYAKYVMKRIPHALLCNMIFIQLVVWFLSHRQGLGIKTHNSLDKNHITSQNMGDPIYIPINVLVDKSTFNLYFNSTVPLNVLYWPMNLKCVHYIEYVLVDLLFHILLKTQLCLIFSDKILQRCSQYNAQYIASKSKLCHIKVHDVHVYSSFAVKMTKNSLFI